MKRFKHYVVLVTLLVALLAGLIFYFLYWNPSFKFGGEDKYQVNTVELPSQVHFGGESVPVWNSRLKARYLKELKEVKKKSREKALLIKRANTFFPTIERILVNEGVPQDLKYVALVESRLLHGFSRKGAAGFWQIMPHTAKHLGLVMNQEIDERFHLEKSTRAMAKLFKEYRKRFGSWSNAAAAYNMGPEKLERLLQKQGDTLFFNLKVNAETARFFFKILACKALFENPEQMGFRRISAYGRYMIRYKAITIKSPINSLQDFSKENGIGLHHLKAANPWLRGSSLSLVSESQSYELLIPLAPDTSALMTLSKPKIVEPE